MIRSTFAGFTTAQLAMAASQRALDVSGQNIANINTPGYTKQRLDIASLNVQGGDFYNSNNSVKVGFGVQMTRIEQLRDPFLDAQYRSQMSKLGTTDAHSAGFEQLTPIFDESVKSGVMAALESISSSLQTLSTQVGNKEFDTMVRSNMQILLNLFRDNSSRLSDVREDAVNGFETADVKSVNEIMENIANLNRSIKNSQILGNPALELQDQRNSLLDELSSYLPISVKYHDEEIGPGQFVEILDVSFTDTDGNTRTLVNDGDYGFFKADTSDQPIKLLFNDAYGVGGINLTERLGSGTLKGTLDYLNKSGDFDDTDFKGIGYYEKAFDCLVNEFATVFNELNKPNDTTIDGYPCPLFETTDGSDTFTASNIKLAEGWINGTYGLTASKDDSITGEVGSSDNKNILTMIKALSAEQQFEYTSPAGAKNTFFKGSFYSCFLNIQNTLAIDTQSSQTMLDNQISVLNQTANSRDGISGVQLDEEGMDLMHYNQSYTAAARFMTTLDEALDVLLNKTGIVGR